MKIKLTTRELYPVYVATDGTTDSGIEIDLPDGLWERYLAAKGVFYELLDEVDDICARTARKRSIDGTQA